MATAILSAITKVPVKADVAMTGEDLTFRGRVLAIGGLKEKLLAAKTAGMKTVLVPRENEKDVEENLPGKSKTGWTLSLWRVWKRVIGHAFAGEPDTSGE